MYRVKKEMKCRRSPVVIDMFADDDSLFDLSQLCTNTETCVSEARNIQAVIGNENWFPVDSAGKILTE